MPWLIFALVIAAAGAWFFWSGQQAARKAAGRIALAASLGLPAEFPLEFVPLEPSIEVESVEQGAAQSREGEPMTQWTVTGHSKASYKEIHEFYREHFAGLGWMQTQMISIPTGQSADYANESMVVHLEIERPKSRQDTSFKMQVYRVVGR